MAQNYQYPQFAGLEFATPLTEKQVTKLDAKVQEAQADFEIVYEGRDLAKLLAMFIPALKGQITVANATSTVLAKMVAALSDKAIQAKLDEFWAKVQSITAKVTAAVSITIEAMEGYFTFDEGKIQDYRLPVNVTVNGKAVKREIKLPADLFSALAESTEAMNTAQTLFGSVTFKLDESLFPDRKTHRAWEVQKVEGVWQPVKAERATPTGNGGTHASKGLLYDIVAPDGAVVLAGIKGKENAAVQYAQKYPDLLKGVKLNLSFEPTNGKLHWLVNPASGKPYIRISK